MIIDFVIREWAAWASGLDERERWLEWAGHPELPASDDSAPALAAMPALSRRRLNPLGRAAAQVTYELADPVPAVDEPAGTPTVYTSRYGDAGRSLALLADLVRGEPISPTAFGLSVHNAIGAMVSIARGDRAHHTALAGGACSAGIGLIEAAGLLADGESSVLLVHYDAPLPGDYAAFTDEASAPYAWAWRVATPRPGEEHLRLQLEDPTSPADAAQDDGLPFGLALMRFALSNQACWQRDIEGRRWRWSRRG